jgi:lipoprotein-anchoring transpeptidase ErfK/SrfK
MDRVMFRYRFAALCAASVAAVLAHFCPPAAAQGCDDRFPMTCPGYRPSLPPDRGPAPAPLPPPPRMILPPAAQVPDMSDRYTGDYRPFGGERFAIPPVDLSQIDPRFLRRTVSYPTSEPPGTIIISPREHFLYLVLGGGQAVRYGVGVGRQGFGWSGTATVHEKREWPDWYPPKEMIERQPEIRRQLTDLQSGIGMPGGLRNPLGARALYLWQGNKDTLYRIHGTIEPWTIGKSVSSGCIRMINQDVVDLYNRTPIGTKVVVLGARSSASR